MTHTEFNQLLSSIKGLTPEQVQQLRQQLDRELRPAEEAAGSDARQGRQTRQARRAREEAASTRAKSSGRCWLRPHHLAARSRPGHRRRRSRRSAGPHQGRAAVGNHHPRAALRWPAAYFVDSSALVKRYVQEIGTAWVRGLTRRSPSTVIYIARITAVEVTSAVARRRKGRTLTSARRRRSSTASASISPGANRRRDDARPVRRCHAAGEYARAARLRCRAARRGTRSQPSNKREVPAR